MRRSALTFAAVLTAALVSTGARGQARADSAAAADRTYEQLVDRLRKGDTAVDYTALRMARAHGTHYSPYDTPDAAAHYDQHARAKEYAALAAAADTVLDWDYTNVAAHMVRAWAAEQMGKEGEGRVHRAIDDGLVRSITSAGQGTRESPYVVISVGAEYAVLRSRGLRSTGQALDSCAGRTVTCDRLDTAAEDGTAGALFFDVTLPIGVLQRAFDHAKP